MNIVVFGHPALRTVSAAVEPQEFQEVADSIYPRMRKLMLHHKGCGLAANQLGITKRFFVFQDGIAINPILLRHGLHTEWASEGCLSFPGMTIPVKRHKIIDVAYTNALGDRIERTLTGSTARCFQHELDHLNGIVIFKAKTSSLS